MVQRTWLQFKMNVHTLCNLLNCLHGHYNINFNHHLKTLYWILKIHISCQKKNPTKKPKNNAKKNTGLILISTSDIRDFTFKKWGKSYMIINMNSECSTFTKEQLTYSTE